MLRANGILFGSIGVTSSSSGAPPHYARLGLIHAIHAPFASQVYHALDTPPTKGGRFSVLRGSLRHLSPTGLPVPLYVLGGVVVAM
jgi:hypothetical protein